MTLELTEKHRDTCIWVINSFEAQFFHSFLFCGSIQNEETLVIIQTFIEY